MTLVEILYGILFQPVDTFRYLGQEKPLARGLLLFILVYGLNLVVNQGIEIISLENGSMPGRLLWVYGLLGGAILLFGLFLAAGILSLLSEICYGRSNGKGIMTTLAFTVFPGALGPPLHYLAILLKVSWLGMGFSLIAALWVMILQVISVRESFHLNTGQAVFIYFLPGILLAVLLLAISGFIGTVIHSLPLPG